MPRCSAWARCSCAAPQSGSSCSSCRLSPRLQLHAICASQRPSATPRRHNLQSAASPAWLTGLRELGEWLAAGTDTAAWSAGTAGRESAAVATGGESATRSAAIAAAALTAGSAEGTGLLARLSARLTGTALSAGTAASLLRRRLIDELPLVV